MKAGGDKLTAEGKRFFDTLSKLQELQVRVGFEAGKAFYDDGTDVAEVALYNELGTSTAPARPFLRQSVDNHPDKITELFEAQAKRLAKGASAEDVLTQIGLYAVRLVDDEITDGGFAENAASTVRKKKSETPLIDTGRMRQSVQYVIKPKSEGET